MSDDPSTGNPSVHSGLTRHIIRSHPQPSSLISVSRNLLQFRFNSKLSLSWERDTGFLSSLVSPLPLGDVETYVLRPWVLRSSVHYSGLSTRPCSCGTQSVRYDSPGLK